MLVDSSGSRNPPDRPTATQLPCQACWRWPVQKRSTRGSVSGSPSMWASSACRASASLAWRLL
jgi:hypothetical protein